MNDTGWEAPRWRAVIWYRTESGSTDVEHFLSEIEDLHDVVEAGPHFDTIEKIEVFRVFHSSDEMLTVEGAARL